MHMHQCDETFILCYSQIIKSDQLQYHTLCPSNKKQGMRLTLCILYALYCKHTYFSSNFISAIQCQVQIVNLCPLLKLSKFNSVTKNHMLVQDSAFIYKILVYFTCKLYRIYLIYFSSLQQCYRKTGRRFDTGIYEEGGL